MEARMLRELDRRKPIFRNVASARLILSGPGSGREVPPILMLVKSDV